jgi:hypothetical protein
VCSHFRVFGFVTYVLILDEKRSNLDPECRKLMFIGCSDQSKDYRVLDIGINNVIISRDVIVDEKSGIYQCDSDLKLDEN